MIHNQSKEYLEGIEAAHSLRIAIWENPYDPDKESTKHQDWKDGYEFGSANGDGVLA